MWDLNDSIYKPKMLPDQSTAYSQSTAVNIHKYVYTIYSIILSVN